MSHECFYKYNDGPYVLAKQHDQAIPRGDVWLTWYRIHFPPGHPVINLDDDEMHLYKKSGLHLARFIKGKLVELFDLKADTADQAIANAIAWLKESKGDVLLVSCLSHQLSQPHDVALDDDYSMSWLRNVLSLEFKS